MTILDIGGGFRDTQESFIEMASAAKDAIAQAKFPVDVRLIAEPGRFFARRAYSLVCQVISVRQPAEPVNSQQLDPQQPGMLYQNDGIYTSFMNRLVEKEEFIPILIPKAATGASEKCTSYTYSVWGPTCDSTDCISRQVGFDRQIETGDWLMYENMGG
jgi:ornithine decarboxylase